MRSRGAALLSQHRRPEERWDDFKQEVLGFMLSVMTTLGTEAKPPWDVRMLLEGVVPSSWG